MAAGARCSSVVVVVKFLFKQATFMKIIRIFDAVRTISPALHLTGTLNNLFVCFRLNRLYLLRHCGHQRPRDLCTAHHRGSVTWCHYTSTITRIISAPHRLFNMLYTQTVWTIDIYTQTPHWQLQPVAAIRHIISRLYCMLYKYHHFFLSISSLSANIVTPNVMKIH